MKQYGGYIYILSNKKDGVLYVGVTNNLIRRIYEHKIGVTECFTNKYFLDQLLYYEQYGDIMSAIIREKQIKGWTRNKKILLFKHNNPDWNDLYGGLFQ